MKEVIGFAFRSGFTSLEAYTHKDNLASTKLLLKYGFVHDKDRKDPENPYQSERTSRSEQARTENSLPARYILKRRWEP